ncbi:MAG: major capsid protein [Microvirus sp.]|nr:MAG: major capsid protein [Microvirus sp.]
MKSVMNHNFSLVPDIGNIQRSVFDRGHGYKTAFNEGYLIPFYCDEALPGDTFKCRSTLFVRMTTPFLPVMDNIFLETFYFAVPYRLLWENWQRFCGEQDNPDDPTDFLIPQVETGEFNSIAVNDIFDYMGIPTGINNIKFSALWARAYNLIWNQWFRDQNLQDSVVVPRTAGPDAMGLYALLPRNKKHDYFTSCLPDPQRGPGVEIPLGGTAPVYGNGMSLGLTTGSEGANFGFIEEISTGFTDQTIVSDLAAIDLAAGTVVDGDQSTGDSNLAIGVIPDGTRSGLIADLSHATAATINSLRQAFQLQKFFERDARGGTRYVEKIRSHFGVISPDYRMQRPEYLGGSSSRIMVNPVQQTSATDSTTPQGHLAAYALGTNSNGGFTKSFTEHCVIIGLVTVRADITYQYGMARMFSRRTPQDLYWPVFAHLGEQAVLNKEIYMQGPGHTPGDDDVFGYQERYAEYRYFPSQITGILRSQAATSLDKWHLAEKFITLPGLNETFISTPPDIGRISAVPSEPHFVMDSYIELSCARPMPTYSVPGLIDHF